MNVDVLGYDREIAGEFIMSSDYSAIFFAGLPGQTASRLGLLQSASLSYQHNVQPRFEGGSANLFWLTGQSMGSLQIGRLVGQAGILVGVSYLADRNTLAKAAVSSVEMKLGRLGLTDVQVRQDVLGLKGCVFQNMTFGYGTGSFDVQESFSILAAMLTRSTRV